MQILALILIFFAMGGATESRDLKRIHKTIVLVTGIIAMASIVCYWR